MLDLKKVSLNQTWYAAQLAKRGCPQNLVTQVVRIYNKHKKLQQDQNNLRELRNKLSAKVSALVKTGAVEKQTVIKQKTQAIKQLLLQQEVKLKCLQQKLQALTLQLPNTLSPSTPLGTSDQDNVVLKLHNEQLKPTTTVLPHHEVLVKLGWTDIPCATTMSGARFTIFKGEGAKLARALVNYCLDTHNKNGYTEVLTPVLVRHQTMQGTGQLPKFKNDLFKVENRDLWLIPTAEVSLASYHQNKIISLPKPLALTGYTSCFRAEAGAAGKNTHGSIRLHEFHKVELVKITTKEQCASAYTETLKDVRNLLLALELPFREVSVCAGELGFAAQQTVDFEVWLPSEKRYLEVASASVCGDFQGRRLHTRYRGDNNKTCFVHTINASGLPIERLITVIAENHQTKDQKVRVPEVLTKYL